MDFIDSAIRIVSLYLSDREWIDYVECNNVRS